MLDTPSNTISDVRVQSFNIAYEYPVVFTRDAFCSGVDLKFVRGSGPAGRITHQDLDAYTARPPERAKVQVISSSGTVTPSVISITRLYNADGNRTPAGVYSCRRAVTGFTLAALRAG